MFFGNHVLLILSPVRSPSPDTKKALEALAAVERRQSQLLWVLPLTVLYRSKHANWIKVILTCSWFHDRWPWKQACPFVSNHRTILMIFFRRWSNGRKRDPVKLFALAAAYCSKNLFVWMGLSRGFKLRHNSYDGFFDSNTRARGQSRLCIWKKCNSASMLSFLGCLQIS